MNFYALLATLKIAMHRKVQVWIFSTATSQCLLLQTNKARGTFWQPVTGSAESQEDFTDAVFREAQEETGFTFSEPPYDAHYEFHFQSRFGPTHEKVYALTVTDLPTPSLDPQEHQSFQWIDAVSALGILKFPTNQEGLRRSYFSVFHAPLVGGTS